MMSEAVVTFQSQLSGVMETVFKAAMYEITRLVEDSFLEEVTRSREQVETLKRRLKSSESRRKERVRDGDRAAGTRCVDCGRVGLSAGGEEGGEIPGMQTQTDGDHKLKQEGVVKEIHSCRGIARAMEELGPDTNSSVKSPGVGNEKLNRLLKEEVLNITSDSTELPGKWHVNLDGEEESNLSGPSTGLNDREIQQCQDEWDTGLDQRPDPGLEGDATDPSEPLYRGRCGMEDLGGFGKTGYGGGHMFDMSSLEGLQESPPRLAEELSYMGHYEGDLGASDGTVHRPHHQPAPNRSRRGALGSPVDPPSRPNMDVDREFSCMLINEQGYLQDPSVLYPEHMSGGGETVNRAGVRGQGGGHIGDHSLQNSDVYNPSETYSLTLNLDERLQQQQHQTGGGAKAGRRHNCTQCSASFSDSASLKAHKLTHKAGGGGAGQGPPFSCNQCGKTFTQACNLKVHQRIHSGQGLHLCSHCGKGFPSFSELKTHKCSQTGDKPYCCSVCGNKFSRLWNLKLHRRIHTQEKPHQCTMCDKSFTRADILKVHQRTHTGERPYCCTICGLSFKRLDHLKSHQRKHRPVCKPEAGWGEIGLN